MVLPSVSFSKVSELIKLASDCSKFGCSKNFLEMSREFHFVTEDFEDNHG